MTSIQKITYVLAGVVLMTTQPVLVKLSQVRGAEGTPTTEYSKFSSVLFTELGKAIFSGVMLIVGGKFNEVQPCVEEMLQFIVPSLIYCINNWLVFVILEFVDPTTFQLLGQLKIVFTGVLFRVVLGRHLNEFQWLAICQLACGATVSQIPISDFGERKSNTIGVALIIISCFLSAMAGIYSEKIMKDRVNVTIHWQNFQLYCWGVPFCFIGEWVSRFLQPGSDDQRHASKYLGGYNAWAIALVFNNILMGLSISAILKFVDNIARVYAHTVAMLITLVLSVILWHEKSLSLQMFLGIAIVSSSAIQYNLDIMAVRERLDKAMEEQRAIPCHPKQAVLPEDNTASDSTSDQ